MIRLKNKRKIVVNNGQIIGMAVITALATKQIYNYIESKLRRYELVRISERSKHIVDVEFEEIEEKKIESE